MSAALNAHGKVGHEKPQVSAGGEEQLNRTNPTRTNHGNPWERAAPAALTGSQEDVFSPLFPPLSPSLLRDLFGATRVWAQLGLRTPRGGAYGTTS